MIRRRRPTPALLLVTLTALTGCHPTQPFYLHEDGDLSHYLDKATDVENPDVYEPKLAEVEHAREPLTVSDPDFEEIWDLSLEEAVSIALNNSKVIRNLGGVTPFGFADALVGRTAGSSTIYDPAIAESDPNNGVEAALSAFDAQLSVLGSNNGNIFTQTDRPSTFQTDDIIRRNLGGLRTELAKQAATGTQFFLRNQTDYTRGDNLLGAGQPVNSVWETFFEAEVRQPLLRGKGTQINRIPVVLARINTDVNLATFEASVRNLLLDIENTYWDLHFAYRSLESAKVARDSAQVTWHVVYELFQAESESSENEAQAREQYYSFRAQLESALTQLYETEAQLRFLMGLSPSDGRLIRPSDEPTTAKVKFDWHQAHSESLVRTAELRQQKWTIKRRELELIAAKNQLLPQLDVGATYRWFGAGDNLINADRNGIDFVPTAGNRNPNDPRGPVGSTAFDVLTNGFYQEGAFFFSFQMPVGFRSELAGVRNAQLNLAREKARLEEMELNNSHLLTSALRSLALSYRNAQTHFNRWRAADKEVEARETKYEFGTEGGSIDLVLDAQRRRAIAQNDYYRSLSDYNQAIAQIHFRKGSLLEYNNIYLAEGPWPEKAYWDALGHARERDASYYFDYGSSRPSVVSQGPAPQATGAAKLHISDEAVVEPTPQPAEESPSGELIPTPEPMTPEGPEAPEEAPEEAPDADDSGEPGPITIRPEGPALNSPDRAEVKPGSGGFGWGNLGLEQNRGSVTANPLRRVSHGED